MRILGIETSCDETGLALVEANGGLRTPRFRLVKNLVASQTKIHAPFGGVVPHLAKREHGKNLPILWKKIKNYKINVIAVTVGPGLEPCLWEGINFARDLAEKYKRPMVTVNHMEGHIASVLLDGQSRINFPAIALLVSGGHTELVLLKNWLNYKIVGETLDDAVGEAFDKVARLLGLPHPGGPALAKLADAYKGSTFIKLPRPMMHSKDLNFSFSGLKTAVLYALRDNPKLNKGALAKEFQNAAIDVLMAKTLKTFQEYRPKTLIIAGGVAANKHLQKELKKKLKGGKIKILFPQKDFTGDNAAMIAAAGYFKAVEGKFAKPANLKASGRLSLDHKSR